MLERLRLTNVGPAAEIELACHPRANLLTGDNGLGKTFLLDTAWWSLTGHWPHDVNPRLTVGFPARPRLVETAATIEGRFHWFGRALDQVATWSQERWTRDHAGAETLVVYAHADGSMSVWDPLRNYPGKASSSAGGAKSGYGDNERRPAYVFSEVSMGADFEVIKPGFWAR